MADETELPNINDIPGVDTMPSIDPETGSELDKLLLDATEGKGEDKGTDGPPVVDEAPVVPPVVEDAPVVPTVVPPVVPEPDELDKVALPTNIKPKTSEAFDTVKRVAREKITLMATRTKELETKLAEFETRLKDGGMTPELKKELEELRGFKSKLDVEADPEFKTYDAKVTASTESIYSRLIAGGASQEVVDKIKTMGGINAIEWEPLLAKLPPQTKRFIEAKLVEIEDIGEKKDRALKEAKENSLKYVQSRQEQTAKQRETAHQTAKAHGEKLLAETAWMKPLVAEANASSDRKKEVEDYNGFLKEAAQAVAEAAGDDSPEMRAILGLGVAELMKVRRDFATYKAQTEAQTAQIKKDLKESSDLLEKIKKGSTQRLRHTPASDELGANKNAGTFNESGMEAIDRLAREAAAGAVPV